ncbi:Lipid III flippase [compost metagenome]
MLNKVKKIIKSDLARVFSLNALSTLIKMLTGFISIKVVAMLVGPVGIALLGQLNNFSSIVLTVSTGGINSGVTKYIAENAGNESANRRYLRSAFWITFILSICCGLVLILGSGFFAESLLKEPQYTIIFIVFGFTIILYALNNLLVSILNGYKEFKKYVIVNISSSIVGLIFSIVLVYFWGVFGALLSAVTYQSIIFLITLMIVVKSKWFKMHNFFGRFNLPAAKNLSKYSLMALVSTAVIPVGQIIIRNFITKHLSIDSAGLWEGMNRISSMYLMVITTSLSVYYLPRLSEIKTDIELNNEIIHTYKVVMPPLIIISGAIYVSRHFIIQVLFNDKFSEMENLFPFQLIGDVFKVASWILGYQFVAKARATAYVLMEVLFSIGFILLAMFFIAKWGNIGATIAYSLN